MLKHAIALIVLAALAAPAGAAISLDYTTSDLGDGLTQYTFVIRNDDGLLASYAATMAFFVRGGTMINQEYVMGSGADDEPTADFLVNFGLNKARDTFSLEPFTAGGSIPGSSLLNGDSFSGYRQTETYFEFSVGTGAGSEYGDNTPLAQIVTDGEIDWRGTIARNNQLYEVGGLLIDPDYLWAGGPYTIEPGETLELRPDVMNLLWDNIAWDLDRDITGAEDYETPVGDLFTDISYDYLLSLGLEPGNTYEIAISADYTGAMSTTKHSTTRLTITPEPASLAMLALGATALLRRRWR